MIEVGPQRCSPKRATVEPDEGDALERHNLATDRAKNAELIEAMNAKRNAPIGKEVDEDVGRLDGGWVVRDAVYDV